MSKVKRQKKRGKFICIAHFNNKAIQSALHKTLKALRQNVKATQGNIKDIYILLKSVKLEIK